MAIEIRFTGYVKEVKSGVGSNGKPWALAKVVHNQVKRNADDTAWETVGRDYFDVFLPANNRPAEDDRIEVVGKLKTSTFDKKDGSKGISLSVNADSVVVVGAAKGKPTQSAVIVPDSWTPVSEDDDELPF